MNTKTCSKCNELILPNVGCECHERTIEELGRRFDYCREQIAVAAIDDFANNRWGQMADNMEKAVIELNKCIHDARLLKPLNEGA